jgi:serine/threonine protein phosphatase PrpC
LELLSPDFFALDGWKEKMAVENPRQLWAEWNCEPSDNQTGATGFMASKGESPCEDAPPVFLLEEIGEESTFAAAVFDGMGGSGARLVDPLLSGARVAHTQAYLGARLARRTVERSLTSTGALSLDVNRLESDLTYEFARVGAALQGGANSDLLRGSMMRTLPTTFAGVVGTRITRSEWELTALWAGDSRVYLLSPSIGLQQVTRDHLSEDDPFIQSRSDHRVQRCLSASSSAELETVEFATSEPSMVIVATDGLFHYLPTPGSLEYRLLDAMSNVTGLTSQRIGPAARSMAADDVSLAIVFLGFENTHQASNAFRRRRRMLEETYRPLFDAGFDSEAMGERCLEIWASERPSYTGLWRR